MSDARPRIVVLEDEEALRRLWLRLLENAGYDCEGAGNTTTMRALLEARPADLMISDVHLPGESGITFLRDISVQYPGMGVLMASGMGDSEIAAEAIKLGASGYLLKPVTPKQLLMSVANAFETLKVDLERQRDVERLAEEVGARDEELAGERELVRQNEQTVAENARRADERGRLADSLRRRADRFERLAAVQRAIPARASLTEIAEAIAGAGADLSDGMGGEVLLLDPAEPRRALMAARKGFDGGPETNAHTEIGDGLAARALAARGVATGNSDTAAEPVDSWLEACGVTHAVATVLFDGGVPVAVLTVGRRGGAFGEEQLDMLSKLAEHAGLVLGAAQAQERLPHVFRDVVTGLPAADAMRATIARCLESRDTSISSPGLALIAIDAFLNLQPAGVRDAALKSIAGALSSATENPVAYLGTGRFAVLLAGDACKADPLGTTEKLRRAAADAVVAPKPPSISAGVAYGDEDGDLLLRHASVALLRSRGTGRCGSFQGGRAATLRSDETLEGRLMRAVEGADIGARFQPVVSLPHRVLTGFEVVPHWPSRQDPVSPLLFMPLAEHIGLADQISRRLLPASAGQVHHWNAEYRKDDAMALFYRLTGAELDRPDLVADLNKALSVAQLRPGQLVLEVDEHVLSHADPSAADRLTEIAELGVRIGVYDFGGRSVPIDYLERLPVHVVRVSRELVEGLGLDVVPDAFLKSVIDLVHGYGAQVFAPGVERTQQMVKLRGLGCDLGQGAHFSVPVEAQAVTAMFQRAARGSGQLTMPGDAGILIQR